MFARTTHTIASLIIAGGALALTVPTAFAGPDEAQVNSFWRTGQTPDTTAGQGDRSYGQDDGYRATYLDPEAAAPTTRAGRKSRGSLAPADAAQPAPKDPPYFYHSMGTMGVP